jgi:uncharacterized repeat protein (TIGR03803 family)
LILSGNTLYGTTRYGGGSGNGTVFTLNTDGTGFTILYSFTAESGPSVSNSDGASPYGLILSGNTLYGTANSGGSSGKGTVFALNTDGSAFTTLYSFTAFGANYTNSDGANPRAGLLLSGSTLYGTTYAGGSSGNGTVFALNTDGTGFTNLYSFTAFGASYTNSDGANPWAGLIVSGNTLYGTANSGGSSGNGTVFALNTNGTGFTTLHTFTALNNNTNSDGGNPEGGLVLSGNTLYGETRFGGSSDKGTVFALNTNGTSFTTLHTFTALNNNNTNSDGAWPVGGLIVSGTTLFGTASGAGSSGDGTVFAVNPDGTGFTTMHSFTASTDGGHVIAGLTLSSNTLYGTAYYGGSSGDGTVFSLSLPASAPQLTIIPSAASVILTWPTNAAGFTLQSTTNLLPPAAWTTVSPDPVVVNGQNTVTNLISGAQQFYRLSQ